MKLVPYWRSAWRFWSVRFAAFGAVLWSYFAAFPEAAINAWNLLPPEFKAYIPVDWQKYVTIAIFVLTVISRITFQTKANLVIEEKMQEKVADGTVEQVTMFKPAEVPPPSQSNDVK